MMIESNALHGKPVDMRRVNRLPVASEPVSADVMTDDEKNVFPLLTHTAGSISDDCVRQRYAKSVEITSA